jgi:tetratricopeptide (TPR) repeat protein
MTQGETNSQVKRSLKLEGLLGLAFMGLFWIPVGIAAYQAFPVVICLNELNTSNQYICRNALSRAFVPTVFRSKIRVKLVGMLGEGSDEEILKLVNEEERDNPLSGFLLLNRANAFRNLDKTSEAVAAFHDVLKSEPANEDAIISLLRLRTDKKQFKEAREEAQSYININPESWNTIAWLGWIEHMAGNHDVAVDQYARAIKLSPDVYWLSQDLGDIHVAAGRFDKAVEAFTRTIEIDPDLTDGFLRRAEVYDALNDYRHAQADYEKALELSRNYDTLVMLGRSYTDSEDFARAAAIFDEVFKSEDLDDWGHASKIRMFYNERRFSDAKSAIAALKKFQPESVHAIYWEATLADEEGRDTEALSGYLKTLESWENEFFPNLDVGHVLVDLNRPTESFAYFNKAIEIRPYSADALNGRSRAQLANKNWSAALADAEKSIALDSKQPIGYARRAAAEAELGQIDKAKADYAISIQNNPKIKWVHQENLDFLIENNLLQDAKSALQTARLNFPDATFIKDREAVLRQRGVILP